MKIAVPRAFLIASTQLDQQGLFEALTSIGAGGWQTIGMHSSEALIEFAGKLCYMSFDKSLNSNLTRMSTRTNAEYIQQQLIGQKHGSVLEHASVTFLLAGVSRVVTHEFVRHRAGTAFSQVSGRYVRAEPAFYIPRALRGNEEAVKEFTAAHMDACDSVERLERIMDIDSQDFATKKKLTSAIRRVTGNGQANHMVMTANHRSWRHIIAMRTSEGAEEEIRDVGGQIARALRSAFPAIYADMVETPASDFPDLPVYTFTHEKV